MIRRFKEQVLSRIGQQLTPVIGAVYPITAN